MNKTKKQKKRKRRREGSQIINLGPGDRMGRKIGGEEGKDLLEMACL